MLDGSRKPSAFVAEEAKRLRVTRVTIRNAIARARQGGWLEPGTALAPSAMARQRYSNVFTVLEMRWNAALDLMERGVP